MTTPLQPPPGDEDRKTTPQQAAPVDQLQPVLPMQEELTAEERYAISRGAASAVERHRQRPKPGEKR